MRSTMATMLTVMTPGLAACGDAAGVNFGDGSTTRPAVPITELCDRLAGWFLDPPEGDAAVDLLRELAAGAPPDLEEAIDVVTATLDQTERFEDLAAEELQALNDVLAFVRIDCGEDPIGLAPFSNRGSFFVTFTGDLAGAQTGRAQCDVDPDLHIWFQPDVFRDYDYVIRMDRFPDLSAATAAEFELSDNQAGTTSTGTVHVTGGVEYVESDDAGNFNFEGEYAGAAGSGSVSGHVGCVVTFTEE